MNDEAFDELVALYRQSANETAPRRLDARVLREAEKRTSTLHAWPWLGLAFAASLALWLAAQHGMPRHRMSDADEATRAYLLQMDITPPSSRLDASHGVELHHDTFGTLP
jgi:hypothetical protein